MGAQVAMTLVNGKENSVLDEMCVKPAQVQAIIGETYSSVSMAVAQSIGPFSIPLVRMYKMCAFYIMYPILIKEIRVGALLCE